MRHRPGQRPQGRYNLWKPLKTIHCILSNELSTPNGFIERE